MADEWKYRGRVITAQDIDFLRQTIAENPELSRRQRSAKVRQAWDWRQTDGAPRDMVRRSLPRMLDRAGQIRLPEVCYVARNPLAQRKRPHPY